MSRYSDAEKAAYWRSKALAKTPSGRTKKYSSGGKKYRPKESYEGKLEYAKYRDDSRRKGKGYNAAPGIISSIGSSLGGVGGGMLGGPAGALTGNFLGGKLGHLIENITGFGDYKVHSNTIMTGGMSPLQVVNSINRDNGVILRHREYLGDIPATVVFTVQSFLINPGLSSTFPWLSQIANSYEQYRIRGMLFEFNSTSSDALLSAATSTALGSVVMQTDYDVADLPPTSKRQMLNSEWSCSSKPSCTFIHPIECKKNQSTPSLLYTRGAIAVPAGFDQRLYDFARFNIATEGMQAAGGVLGELWITYELELFKQQFSFVGLTDHFRLGAVTNVANLGTAAQSSVAAGGTIGGAINVAGDTYSFPPQLASGKYLVTYWVLGGAQAVTIPTVTYINCTGLNYFANDTVSIVGSPTPPLGILTTVTVEWLINLTQQNAGFKVSAGLLPQPFTSGDLVVTRIADSIVA